MSKYDVFILKTICCKGRFFFFCFFFWHFWLQVQWKFCWKCLILYKLMFNKICEIYFCAIPLHISTFCDIYFSAEKWYHLSHICPKRLLPKVDELKFTTSGLLHSKKSMHNKVKPSTTFCIKCVRCPNKKSRECSIAETRKLEINEYIRRLWMTWIQIKHFPRSLRFFIISKCFELNSIRYNFSCIWCLQLSSNVYWIKNYYLIKCCQF